MISNVTNRNQLLELIRTHIISNTKITNAYSQELNRYILLMLLKLVIRKKISKHIFLSFDYCMILNYYCYDNNIEA